MGTHKTKKKYYQNLSHKYQTDCFKHIIQYQHPKGKYYAIFPFVINHDEAHKLIFDNILPENSGLSLKDWLKLKKSYKSDDEDKYKSKLFSQIKKEIDFKLSSATYELVSSKTVINTFNYLFQKISSGIYVQIKDNKLSNFIPFINTNFVNEWSDIIEIPKKYKNLDQYYKEKQKEFGGKLIKYLPNKDLWRASNCLIQTGHLALINDSYWAEIYQMIEETAKEHKLNDVEFFLNLKSFPLLKNNFTEPFNDIFGNDVPLKSHDYASFHPILSISTNDNFGDLSYPSAEDWRLVTKEYFRNDCHNNFLMGKNKQKIHGFGFDMTQGITTLDSNKDNYDWDDKIEKGYFFGDTSGCGIDSKNNSRLKLLEISKKEDNLEYLEVILTRFSKRDKKNKDQPMDFQKPSHYDIEITKREKSSHGQYKYLISIPGYGIDSLLPYYLSLGGLVLRVESKHKVWYDYLLKPYKHYIPIKSDLSDLISVIKWAKKHPESASKIAKNGNIVYKKFFTRKTIMEYWAYLLNSISSRRLNLDSLDQEYHQYESEISVPKPRPLSSVDINLDKIKKYKLGIVIPYLNKDKDHRDALKELLNNLTTGLRKYDANFIIIIVEQSNKHRKFNKGQLLNLGALIAKNNNCTHIVFNNLIHNPKPEMIKYYLAFDNSNQVPVHLKFTWSGHHQKKYFSYVCLWNLNMFLKFGGFSNQVWGWGCSDKILYHRYRKVNKTDYFYYPIESETGFVNFDIGLMSTGQIIDYHYQNLKILEDWNQKKYNDLKNLEGFLIKPGTFKYKKNSKPRSIKTYKTHSFKDDTSETDTDYRYKQHLKVLDHHKHHKEVEHYIFKLIKPKV